MKKYVGIIIVMLIAIVSTTVHFVVSFIMDQSDIDEEVVVGEVTVLARAYYQDGAALVAASEVQIAPGVFKNGIYFVNIVDSGALEFIENFRLYIEVYSNVNTYFRIKVVEQLTLTFNNIDGGVTEIAVLSESPMDFNYQETNWYDNRSSDGYFYYMVPAQRISQLTPQTIGLITSYYPDTFFSSRPLGYSLQIGLVVEAVQAVNGPQNNWGMETAPWGGAW